MPTSFKIREDKIDGVGPWYWIEADDGAWTGPKGDWEDQHRPKILEYVPEKRCVLQAGGCMGMYPRLLSQIFHKVYTFEPCPDNFECLVRNCYVDNIVKIQAALGDTHKMVKINNSSKSNCGTHTIIEGGEGDIPLLRIDDFKFEHLDLLMLDMEGYERFAIEGAHETIEKHWPIIWAENGGSVEPQLTKLGYTQVGSAAADLIFKHNN